MVKRFRVSEAFRKLCRWRRLASHFSLIASRSFCARSAPLLHQTIPFFPVLLKKEFSKSSTNSLRSQVRCRTQRTLVALDLMRDRIYARLRTRTQPALRPHRVARAIFCLIPTDQDCLSNSHHSAAVSVICLVLCSQMALDITVLTRQHCGYCFN